MDFDGHLAAGAGFFGATLAEETMTDKALTGLADASANEMAKAA